MGRLFSACTGKYQMVLSVSFMCLASEFISKWLDGQQNKLWVEARQIAVMIQYKQRDNPGDTVCVTLLQLYGQANRVLLGDSRKNACGKVIFWPGD